MKDRSTGRWHDSGTLAWAQFRESEERPDLSPPEPEFDGRFMVGIAVGIGFTLVLAAIGWLAGKITGVW